MFHRCLAVLGCQVDFFLFHLAAGVGDVYRAVDHGSNARSRTAAGYGNGYFRGFFAVGFGPGLGYIDQGVRALVLYGGTGLQAQG